MKFGRFLSGCLMATIGATVASSIVNIGAKTVVKAKAKINKSKTKKNEVN